MDRNKIASGLAFYRAPSDPKKAPAFDTASEHLFDGIGLMYEWWFPIDTQIGKTMLLVGESPDEVNGAIVKAHTTWQSEVRTIKTWKNGQQTGQYYLCLVKGYHR